MCSKEERVCRLCLQYSNNDFEVIEDTTAEIINGIGLKINLNVSEDPVMCQSCSGNLQTSLYFKSTVIDGSTLDVKDVYLTEKGDETLCQFCLQYVNKSDYQSLEQLSTVLTECIPDMRHSVTEVCIPCFKSLKNYMQFILHCREVEESVIKYCQEEGVYEKIILNNVTHFKANKIECKEDLQLCSVWVKQEKLVEDVEEKVMFENHPMKMDTEELHIKDEESNVVANENSAPYFKENSKNVLKLVPRPCVPRTKTLSCSKTTTCKCKKCKCKAKLLKQLRIHALTNVNRWKSKVYKCDLCSYESKQLDHMKRHSLVHKTQSEVQLHKCDLCNFKTKYSSSLQSHKNTHKAASERTWYPCEQCDYKTKNKSHLKFHILTHKDPSEIPIYKCERCDYQSKHKSYLRNHVLIHNYVTETVAEAYDNLEISVTSDESHCDSSTYEFKSKVLAKCDFITNNPSQQKDSTVTRQLYKCDSCTYEANGKDDLESHIMTHGGEERKKVVGSAQNKGKVFECEICGLEVRHRSNFRRHRLTHQNPSEIRMYKCELCQYQSRRGDDLKKHMLNHLDDSEVKWFQCHHCEYRSKLKIHLRRHMAVHKRQSGTIR